jgi:hypothetical protein
LQKRCPALKKYDGGAGEGRAVLDVHAADEGDGAGRAAQQPAERLIQRWAHGAHANRHCVWRPQGWHAELTDAAGAAYHKHLDSTNLRRRVQWPGEAVRRAGGGGDRGVYQTEQRGQRRSQGRCDRVRDSDGDTASGVEAEGGVRTGLVTAMA